MKTKLKVVNKDGINLGIVVEEDEQGFAQRYRLLWRIKDSRCPDFITADKYKGFDNFETYSPETDFYEWCDEQGITWYRGEA